MVQLGSGAHPWSNQLCPERQSHVAQTWLSDPHPWEERCSSPRKLVIGNWEDSQVPNRVKEKTKYLLESLKKERIRYSTSNKISCDGHLWINVSWIKDLDYTVKAFNYNGCSSSRRQYVQVLAFKPINQKGIISYCAII